MGYHRGWIPLVSESGILVDIHLASALGRRSREIHPPAELSCQLGKKTAGWIFLPAEGEEERL